MAVALYLRRQTAPARFDWHMDARAVSIQRPLALCQSNRTPQPNILGLQGGEDTLFNDIECAGQNGHLLEAQLNIDF